MRIGVPRESKVMEYRVGMVPDSVASLVRAGHEVWVETGAGEGSGIGDAEFEASGAKLVSREQAWGEPDLVVKVKEPRPDEVALMRPDQVLFTYLHLAANRELTECLCDAGVIALAYETIQNPDGSFPVLAPMSEVAGRMAIQAGAHFLERAHGGSGILLGGVPGCKAAKVLVIAGVGLKPIEAL